MKFPTDITPALGTLPIFYMCHPVAPRKGEVVARSCNLGCPTIAWMPGTIAACHAPRLHGDPVVLTDDPASVIVRNVANARRWWRWLATWESVAVVAPWMVNVEEWTIAGKTDETPGSELVERGLRDDCAVVARLDGVIITNRAGRGSTMEGNAALAADRVAYDLRHYGPMPPDGEPGSIAKLHPKDAEWRAWLS